MKSTSLGRRNVILGVTALITALIPVVNLASPILIIATVTLLLEQRANRRVPVRKFPIVMVVLALLVDLTFVGALIFISISNDKPEAIMHQETNTSQSQNTAIQNPGASEYQEPTFATRVATDELLCHERVLEDGIVAIMPSNHVAVVAYADEFVSNDEDMAVYEASTEEDGSMVDFALIQQAGEYLVLASAPEAVFGAFPDISAQRDSALSNPDFVLEDAEISTDVISIGQNLVCPAIVSTREKDGRIHVCLQIFLADTDADNRRTLVITAYAATLDKAKQIIKDHIVEYTPPTY